MEKTLQENHIGNDGTENTAIKYRIISEEGSYSSSYETYVRLEEEINQYLKNGWILQGGVSVGSIGNDYFCICQAMVKYPERKVEKKENLPGRAIVRI